MLKWQDVLLEAAAGDIIKASSLRRIPHLKDCPYWDKAIFLGKINHRVQYANYDGGLVKYANRIYYVNSAQIEALRPWVRWNLKKIITVVEG
jgi:hypothetical protein